MIKRKKKICDNCHDEKYIFSHGLCLACWKVFNGKHLPSITNKLKERHKRYHELREEYLKERPLCEVCGKNPSTEIHHKRGRVGKNLFQDFLAVDRDCHRRIEENPDWARKEGYILSRI